jgi:hypothetical protein
MTYKVLTKRPFSVRITVRAFFLPAVEDWVREADGRWHRPGFFYEPTQEDIRLLEAIYEKEAKP